MDGEEQPQRTTWSNFVRNRSASMSTFASLTGTMPPLRRSTPSTPTAPSSTRTTGPPRREFIDLRALELVQPCDPNLVCPICHSAFVNPIKLSCDHIFCEDCVKQTWEVQAGRLRTCPHCRARVGSVFARGDVNKIVLAMLDELKVQCPKSTGGEGCAMVMARSEVQDHVDRYCGWGEVQCPSAPCDGWVLRKDVEEGCTHFGVACEDCGEETMKRDLPVHREKECTKGMKTCPDCGTEVLRRDLEDHTRSECQEAVRPCSGSSYGCSFTAKRAELRQHEGTCSVAALAPFLETQRQRQEALMASHDLLQRKYNILEGGLHSVQDMLYTTPTASSTHDGEHSAAQRDGQSSNTTDQPDVQDNHTAGSGLHASSSDPSAPLLSLIESLREDIARVSASVADLDSRHSMMITNDGLRAREDMAHANAAINGLRVQLHWIVSARMQQQRQMLQQQGEGGATGTSAAGSSTGPGVVRRLSDSVRQETKL